MIRRLAVLISLFLFSFHSSASIGAEADLFLGPMAGREKLFESYVRQVEHAGVINSEAIQRRLGVSLASELKIAKELFLEAKNKDDVYFALLALKNAFHDAHSNLTTPEDLESDNRVIELPFVAGVRDIGGRPQFYVVRSEVSDLPVDVEILSTDGVKTSEQITYNRRWLDNSSLEQLWLQTAEWLALRQSWKIPSRKPGELSDVEFKTAAGEVKKIKLPWRISPPKSYGDSCVSWSQTHSAEYAKEKPIFLGLNYCVYKFPKNVLVVRYFSFFYNLSSMVIWERVPFLSFKVTAVPKKKPFFQEIQDIDHAQLKEVINKNKPKLLILDVRENTGGNISPELVAMFAKDKFQLLKRQMVFTDKIRSDRAFFDQSVSLASDDMTPLIKEDLKKKNRKTSRLFPFFCRTSWCTEKEAEFEPDKTVFKTNTVLVTGPRCMSSCDQFAAILQDNHIAKIAGLSSRGGHSPYRADLSLKLHNGAVFKIGVTTGLGFRTGSGGASLDGNPAIPDIKLGPEVVSVAEMVSRVEKALKP